MEKSPKLLDKWIDGVSFESDPLVADKWARLLVDNNIIPTAQLIFCDYLRMIGGDEARWLNNVWDQYYIDGSNSDLAAKKDRQVRHLVRKYFPDDLLQEEILDQNTQAFILEALSLGIIVRGVRYDALELDEASGMAVRREIQHSIEPEDLFPDAMVAIGTLERFGVSVVRTVGGVEENVEVRGYFFSRMGAEFMTATSPRRSLAGNTEAPAL